MMRLARMPAVVLALAVCGCFAPGKKVERRTALEQQVVAAALSRAVSAMPFEAAGIGGRCRVEIAAPKDVDADLVKAMVQGRLYRMGIDITENPAASVPIVRVHVIYAGSDLEYSLFGVPIFIPGIPVMFGGLSAYASETQRGRARLAMSLWQPDGRLVRGEVEPDDGTCYFQNMTFLTFIGPFVRTDMDDFLSPGEEAVAEEAAATDTSTGADGAEPGSGAPGGRSDG